MHADEYGLPRIFLTAQGRLMETPRRGVGL
jgi:hypothetical protein